MAQVIISVGQTASKKQSIKVTHYFLIKVIELVSEINPS